MRDTAALMGDAALVAVQIQKALQVDRQYRADKHFKLTVPEFIMVFTAGQVTATTTVGWFMFLNIPVWIE